MTVLCRCCFVRSIFYVVPNCLVKAVCGVRPHTVGRRGAGSSLDGRTVRSVWENIYSSSTSSLANPK